METKPPGHLTSADFEPHSRTPCIIQMGSFGPALSDLSAWLLTCPQPGMSHLYLDSPPGPASPQAREASPSA